MEPQVKESSLFAEIDLISPAWKKKALEIHSNPETGRKEFFASRLLWQALSEKGFRVKTGAAGLKTAFIAEKGLKSAPRKIAFLAEYDALPGMGHACGHNLIGPASAMAAIALSETLSPHEALIRVIGCPDEEYFGGKAALLEKGAFKGIEAAFMAHGFYMNVGMRPTIGRASLVFEFFGRPAHASTVPEKGINALDAVISLFNNVALLRQQVREEARIHGIITHGGAAANIIPDYTRAEFYVRSKSVSYLSELKKKVIACARGAAKSTGAKLRVSSEGRDFLPLRENSVLERAYEDAMRLTGGKVGILPPRDGFGSSDFGNISRAMPALHGYFRVSENEVRAHSTPFAEASKSQMALSAMVSGAKALSAAALSFVRNAKFREKARAEFLKRIKEEKDNG